MDDDKLSVRIHGNGHSLPTLIYFPGLHGDWTLLNAFRHAIAGKVRLVEMTYPLTTTWTLPEHVAAILQELAHHNVTHGWLLGESFGSQVVWSLMAQISQANTAITFKTDGIILAGGFVKHSLPWGTTVLRLAGGPRSMLFFRWGIKLYSSYIGFRQSRIPGSAQAAAESKSRRTPQNGNAIHHRLRLIDTFDARVIASQTSIPTYHLSATIDPIVPGQPVQSWLARHCPGYRDTKMIWRADHAVLVSAPKQSAKICVNWINAN